MDTAKVLNRDDYGRIYQEFHPRVLMICRRMLGSPEEAEDAADDVFVKLPDSLETYDSSQPFAPWLARVTGNHCIDVLRRRRSERRLIEPEHDQLPEHATPLSSPFEELLSKENSGAIRDAIFTLPERYLVPLVMRYFSDLSYQEIAKTLRTSKANVGLLIFVLSDGYVGFWPAVELNCAVVQTRNGLAQPEASGGRADGSANRQHC